MFTTFVSPAALALELGTRNPAARPVVIDTRFSLADPARGRRDYLAGHIHSAIYAHLDQDLSGAVVAGGKVLMWGDNTKGQLGDGTQDPGLTPQPIGLTGVVELALGDDHSCALKLTGEMLCWGDNRNGELGDGTVEPRLVPTRVAWPAQP